MYSTNFDDIRSSYLYCYYSNILILSIAKVQYSAAHTCMQTTVLHCTVVYPCNKDVQIDNKLGALLPRLGWVWVSGGEGWIWSRGRAYYYLFWFISLTCQLCTSRYRDVGQKEKQQVRERDERIERKSHRLPFLSSTPL